MKKTAATNGNGSRTTSYLPWKTAQSLLKLLQADGQHNTALMCAAGFYFGLRIGDILNLTWGEVLAERFTVREEKTRKRKKKPRIISVHPDFKLIAQAAFDAIPERRKPKDTDFVFVSQEARGNRKKPISKVAAIKRFRVALERYGIETANPSTHTLRKTFGRRVWEMCGETDAALVKLSKVFRHSSVEITRIYLGITEEEIAEVYLSL